MSDDEGGRLLIDDIHDVSGSADSIVFTPGAFPFEKSSDEGKSATTSNKKLTVPARLISGNNLGGASQGLPESMNSDVIVSENLVVDQSKEEGELEDDDTDVLINAEDTSRRNAVRQKSLSPRSSRSTSLSSSTIGTSSSSSGPSVSSSATNSHGQKKRNIEKTNGLNGIALNYTKVRADNTRKRKENENERNDVTTSTAKIEGISAKKHKPSVRDRGTCVHSRAVQSDVDDSLFDMEVGSTALVEMTVVCKLDSNALYVVAKWKDQELSGILTDGQPPAFNTYMKKRPVLNVNGSATLVGSDPLERAQSSGSNTPSKNRPPTTPRDSKRRGGSHVSETKRKLSCGSNRPAGEQGDDDDDVEVSGESPPSVSGSSDVIHLVEIPGRKNMHTCPFDSCQHRYEKGAELDYHKVSAHGKRAVMSESICCQTDSSLFNPKSVYTDVEGLESYAVERENIEELIKTVTSSSLTTEVKKEQDIDVRSPGGFSDISDDGGAPQLQKEEPTSSDVRAPLQISTSVSGAGASNILTSPEFAPSPREISADGITTTKDSRPSSLPVAAATPAAQPSSFQPISGDRPRTHANRASPSVVHPFSSSTIPVSISSSPRATTASAPNSGFLSAAFPHQVIHFPSPISASVRTAPSPARLVTDQHKIPQHKSNEACTSSGDSASTSSSAGVGSTSKTMPSPANSVQRAFGIPMMQQPVVTGSPAQAQLMHAQMFHAAQTQAMQHYMQQIAAGSRGAHFSMPGASAGNPQDQMFAAMQAAIQNPYANLFPK